jgi:hypothetical protein
MDTAHEVGSLQDGLVVDQQATPQESQEFDGQVVGHLGATQESQGLAFEITKEGKGQRATVRVIDVATGGFIFNDKLDVARASEREKFVERLLAKLHVPQDQFEAKREQLLSALEAAADEFQAMVTADADGSQDVPCEDGPGIKNYTKVMEDKGPRTIGLSPQEVTDQLFEITSGFPKRVGDSLFSVGCEHEVVDLGSTSSLFAWMRGQAYVVWEKGPSLMSPEQFHAHLGMNAEAFDAVESMPHHPQMPRVYYSHPSIPTEPGSLLDKFLAMLNPLTEEDRELIRTMILTLCWGGEPGSRPAFLVTGPDDDPERGRGVGKSKLTDIIAGDLAGGMVEVTPSDDIAGVKSRLFSPATMGLQAVRLDNIKSRKMSWSDLEALITSPVISGKALYRGEGRRPNTLTWLLTLNSANLGTDLAQRVIPIKLARPQFSAIWEGEARRFVRENRWPLIGEIISLLRAETAELAPRTRWGGLGTGRAEQDQTG